MYTNVPLFFSFSQTHPIFLFNLVHNTNKKEIGHKTLFFHQITHPIKLLDSFLIHHILSLTTLSFHSIFWIILLLLQFIIFFDNFFPTTTSHYTKIWVLSWWSITEFYLSQGLGFCVDLECWWNFDRKRFMETFWLFVNVVDWSDECDGNQNKNKILNSIPSNFWHLLLCDNTIPIKLLLSTMFV